MDGSIWTEVRAGTFRKLSEAEEEAEGSHYEQQQATKSSPDKQKEITSRGKAEED